MPNIKFELLNLLLLLLYLPNAPTIAKLPGSIGRVCCTTEEPTPHGQVVMGSNPAECWPFSLLFLCQNLSLSRCSTTDFFAIKDAKLVFTELNVNGICQKS